MPRPSVGRIVHYVSYGTPGGEYQKECRAAIITAASYGPESTHVDLCVLNPTGQFFNQHVEYHETAEVPGDPDCPVPHHHGRPFRFCACGWREASPAGGTWHWPERVEEE